MPRLPDIQDFGQRPTPQPPGGAARIQSVTGMEGSRAQMLLQAGSELGRAANEVEANQARAEAERRQNEAVQRQEQERIDQARAEDVFSQLRDRQIDLTFGNAQKQVEGFRQRRGSDAITKPTITDFTDRWKSTVDELSGGLANERQKQLFKNRSDTAGAQYKLDLFQHMDAEQRTYQQQNLDNGVDVEIRMAQASWNDPDAVNASRARIDGLITEAGQSIGQGPDSVVVKDMRLKAYAKLNQGIIGQALAAGNYRFAQDWFTEHQKAGEIDPATAESVSRAVSQGTQKELFNGYQTQFLSVMNSRGGVDTLLKNVLADNTLDEDRKNILVGRLQGQMQTLDNRAAVAQQRAERQVERQIDKLNSDTFAGFEHSPQDFNALVAQTRGTPYEAEVRQAIGLANATSQFRNANPQQQEAMITAAETAARADPNKFDRRILQAWKSMYSSQQDQVRADPISFAVRQGQLAPNDPAALPLDVSKPDQIGPQLQERYGVARTMSGRYGIQQKPLTREEADRLTAFMRTAAPQQKTAYFGALARSSGDDKEGYKALMGQIAPDDPVTAAAGLHAGAGRATLSDSILRGQAILNPPKDADGKPVGGKIWPMPEGPERQNMVRIFQSYEDGAYTGKPQARSADLQTAMAIYADKTVQAGDSSGSLDGGRWEESIRQATGGIARYNGKNTILPWGMDLADFKNRARQAIDAVAPRLQSGMTADKARGLSLRQVDDGKYVLQAADGILGDKDNHPIVLDLSSPAMSNGLVPRSTPQSAFAATRRRMLQGTP